MSLTLLHFLWQGCVIAAAVYSIGGLLQRSSATVRYWLHVVALLLMVACVSATFAIVSTYQNKNVTTSAIESESTSHELADVGTAVGLASDPPIVRPEPDQPTDVAVIAGKHADGLASTIAGISPWLTAFYFAGVAVMLFRLMRSFSSGHRLRRGSTVVDDNALLAMITRQARRVGLKTAPAVAFCSRVTVPTVIGILKPMILLPASLAMGLAPQQLEALLAHELAHIRRFDLVVNLLQRLIEALLFFHPAVWFVSRRVSIERERACDDTVIAAGWQRVNYADALVRMAELSSALRNLQVANQATALMASGSKPSDLKRRVLRLLGHDDLPKVRLTQAGLTIFGVVLTLAVFAPLLVHSWAQSAGTQIADGETERTPDLATPDDEVPRNETDPEKSAKPGKGEGRDAVQARIGLPNEQKLSGKWHGEKDGIKVRLTFHSPFEARWKVDTGCAGIGVSFRNVIDEKAGVIDLWLDYKWVTGDKKGQSGSQILGQARDGAGDTLLLNILPTDLYPPSYRYKPVNDVVLSRVALENEQPDEKPLDEKQGHSNALRVRLSDATWIELAGVTAHPQPHDWWRANGTPMDKGLVSAYPKSPKPGKGDMVREIRVRARIPSDATIKVLFSAAGLQKESRTEANVPESNRSLSDYEFSHVMVDYPSNLRVLKPLTIKVADGKWKTLASCTADGGEVNGIRFELAADEDAQVSLKAWFKVNVRDIRFVVEDIEGNRHVSTKGRELKDEGVSYAFEASVALPRKRIRMIHLQRRPFKWFEFRNVSLHPGYLTAATAKPIGITADSDNGNGILADLKLGRAK